MLFYISILKSKHDIIIGLNIDFFFLHYKVKTYDIMLMFFF